MTLILCHYQSRLALHRIMDLYHLRLLDGIDIVDELRCLGDLYAATGRIDIAEHWYDQARHIVKAVGWD